MNADTLADELGEQMRACPRAAFYALLEALEQLGGELRIDPQKFIAMVASKPPGISIDATDGPIVLRRQ